MFLINALGRAGRAPKRRSRKQRQRFDGGFAPTPRRRRSTGPCNSVPSSRTEPPVQIRQRPTDGRASGRPRQCQLKQVRQFRQIHFLCSLSCELPLLHKTTPLIRHLTHAGVDVSTNDHDPTASGSSCLRQRHRRIHLPLATVVSAHRDGKPHPRRSGQIHHSPASGPRRFSG